MGAVYDAALGSQTWSAFTDTGVRSDRIVCFSNVSTVLDLLAPGARIVSSGLFGGTASMSGTSMACPHTAGLAALMLAANSGLSPEELLDIMTETGLPIYDDRIGLWFPRIDAAAALNIDNPDRDGDGDVDGRDLFLLAGDISQVNTERFASEFGKPAVARLDG